MSLKDAAKTTFQTPINNFYYIVIPYGLKYAEATYQKAMTAIFHDMMHKEIEDYVDNIVWSQRQERIILPSHFKKLS